MTEAHQQAEVHHYIVNFPEHGPRAGDPHYRDFDAYHRRTRDTARCYVGQRIGFGDCQDAQRRPCPAPADASMPQRGLELHHAHIEFAVQNGIDLKALEVDYPGVSNPDEVGAWVESGANFRWLCAWHHRFEAGAHTASHSDWEAGQYVLGLISEAPK